jgi:hypothetical protein
MSVPRVLPDFRGFKAIPALLEHREMSVPRVLPDFRGFKAILALLEHREMSVPQARLVRGQLAPKVYLEQPVHLV